MSNKESSFSILDGSTSSDVKIFFFYYKNVAMRGQNEEELVTQLLSHLDGKTFEFFFDSFSHDGGMKPEALD